MFFILNVVRRALRPRRLQESMSSVAAPLPESPASSGDAAARPHAANGGAGGERARSSSDDEFEEAERLAAAVGDFGGARAPVPAPAMAAEPAGRTAVAPAATEAPLAPMASPQAKPDGKQKPAVAQAAEDKVKSGGCLCFKW